MKNIKIFKFVSSSLICAIIDYLLYLIIVLFTNNVVLSNYSARFVSSIVNYNINKNVVFENKNNKTRYIIEYFILVIFIIIVNTIILKYLVDAGMNKYFTKIIIECILFIFSYLIQKKIIFKKDK